MTDDKSKIKVTARGVNKPGGLFDKAEQEKRFQREMDGTIMVVKVHRPPLDQHNPNAPWVIHDREQKTVVTFKDSEVPVEIKLAMGTDLAAFFMARFSNNRKSWNLLRRIQPHNW